MDTATHVAGSVLKESRLHERLSLGWFFQRDRLATWKAREALRRVGSPLAPLTDKLTNTGKLMQQWLVVILTFNTAPPCQCKALRIFLFTIFVRPYSGFVAFIRSDKERGNLLF